MLAMIGAGAMTAPLAAVSARAPKRPSGQWRDSVIVNALGGLSNPNVENDGGTDPVRRIDARTIADARASGLSAVNVTMGYVSGAMEPFEYSVRTVAGWDRLIRDHPADLVKILSVRDIVHAKAEGRIGIIYGFQNAAMMGDKADRADIFADLGVRIIQLTYNPANAIGDGSMARENRGLTPFGRAVVERLNANRVMVDLSHSGERTCLEAARISKQPISINHTGCRALTDLPRNKTDAELRLVAERGGFVGIYFMPFLNISGHAGAEDVVAHIEHAVNVCGEDHVGIGTDGGTTQIDDMTAYKSRLAQEVERRRAAGIGATGERPDTFPFVIDLRGPTQFRDLADRLRKRGHSAARIEKILGQNFLRYGREIWGD
ncbi:dipeptidase [Sphingomonas colocasiae]|uniref:Dipeptidase n=2 Tax=Sphingomonas colocasiae TaxID=1848973 RepID=A0ABS7PHX0_9SPHN|nr:dipeptidase [Sphingomonas colocasiae]